MSTTFNDRAARALVERAFPWPRARGHARRRSCRSRPAGRPAHPRAVAPCDRRRSGGGRRAARRGESTYAVGSRRPVVRRPGRAVVAPQERAPEQERSSVAAHEHGVRAVGRRRDQLGEVVVSSRWSGWCVPGRSPVVGPRVRRERQRTRCPSATAPAARLPVGSTAVGPTAVEVDCEEATDLSRAEAPRSRRADPSRRRRGSASRVPSGPPATYRPPLPEIAKWWGPAVRRYHPSRPTRHRDDVSDGGTRRPSRQRVGPPAARVSRQTYHCEIRRSDSLARPRSHPASLWSARSGRPGCCRQPESTPWRGEREAGPTSCRRVRSAAGERSRAGSSRTPTATSHPTSPPPRQ